MRFGRAEGSALGPRSGPNQIRNLRAIATAECKLRAITHNYYRFPFRGPGLHLFHISDIHNCGAMDAKEDLRIQRGFQIGNGFAQQVRFSARVNADVIAFGFDPLDFSGAQKYDSSAVLEDEAIEIFLVGVNVLEDGSHSDC